MNGLYAWPPRILQTLVWIPTRLALNFFCHFEVEGTENLNDLSHAIFAVNHSNELDPIILTAALNPLGRFAPMFYITTPPKTYDDKQYGYGWRRYLYRTSWFFKSWGAYPTNPGHKNYAVSLANHVSLLQNNRSVCIFPEGRVTRDGTLQEGHGGVSYLSHATRVPVVPVAIVGSFRLNGSTFIKRLRHLTLRFGEPMLLGSVFPNEIERTSPEEYKSTSQTVMEKIETLLSEEVR